MRCFGHSGVVRRTGAAARIVCRGALTMEVFAGEVAVALVVLAVVAILIRYGHGAQFFGYFVMAHVLGWRGYALWYRFRCWRYWQACGRPQRAVTSERWVANLIAQQGGDRSEVASLARPYWWPWGDEHF